MEFTAGQIAELLGGEVKGDAMSIINTFAKIEEGVAGSISFLANPKYEPFIYTTGATAVIIDKNFIAQKPINASLILVDNPYSAFSTLLEQYRKITDAGKSGIENPHFIGENSTIGEGIYLAAFAYIGKNCKIGKNVKIWPHVFIGDNVTIGENADIQAGVKIYANTIIGNNCIIKGNAVIGSEGFGFAPQPDGTYKNIPQLGNVVIGNDVSIGANTTIDCSTMGSTIIGDGVKLDNLIQVAHNVEIGKNTVLVAQSGIAGSTKVGDNCVIGGQSALVGHITVADGTKVGGQSGVTKSIKKPNTAVNGTPAFDYAENLRSLAVFRRLPELAKQIENKK
ncbi:MAG: UDP-3-O-(3-hydroxymyristoyl)glucosamine N-acyltransferase [Bacteroidota bacterium]